jgi:hypothetical protein
MTTVSTSTVTTPSNFTRNLSQIHTMFQEDSTNVNTYDQRGFTPLHYASSFGICSLSLFISLLYTH